MKQLKLDAWESTVIHTALDFYQQEIENNPGEDTVLDNSILKTIEKLMKECE